MRRGGGGRCICITFTHTHKQMCDTKISRQNILIYINYILKAGKFITEFLEEILLLDGFCSSF